MKKEQEKILEEFNKKVKEYKEWFPKYADKLFENFFQEKAKESMKKCTCGGQMNKVRHPVRDEAKYKCSSCGKTEKHNTRKTK